jgi:transposase, IS30 family
MSRKFPADARGRFVDLICAGASLRAAAEEVGVSPAQAVVWWRESGRMELVMAPGSVGGLLAAAPADDPSGGSPRRRRALTAEDRASIQTGLLLGHGPAQIAVVIGRDRSVVWREIHRNRSRDGGYRAKVAHRAAAVGRSRPKAFKLVANPGLCRRIEAWMDDGWSPKLIARMLATETDRDTDRVSHETIYRALYVQTRGSLRKDLARKLALKRTARKPRGATDGRGTSIYREAFTIRERPAEVADRAVPGHWEGDLILGTGNTSAVGTLVERSTRFVILLHLPGRHDADSVAEAMIQEMSKLPHHLRRSLTWDRGSELAGYRDIQLQLDMPVYFCDPYSPWQRGSNENTNRLLRFWLEKGTDLAQHSAEDLATIAAKLNARPRPTLDLKTPGQALAELLANPAAA